MSTTARHHWLNTIVGILDSAFHLTDEEQFAVADIVTKVLVYLRIPERGEPVVMPVPLSQETHAGYYALALTSPRSSGIVRPVRPATAADVVVPVEVWRETIVGMFTTAYPTLGAEDTLFITKVFDDLLAAIGVPNRAATFIPDTVAETLRTITG